MEKSLKIVSTEEAPKAIGPYN